MIAGLLGNLPAQWGGYLVLGELGRPFLGLRQIELAGEVRSLGHGRTIAL
jgi:hypothetical protein